MRDSLTAHTVHGLKWTYASTAVTFILQIGITAVLARLLTPGAFGTVAMAGVFLSFGQYFAQLGVGQAVVQRRTLSADDFHAAFTSSALLGVAFCALFIALAPLSAALFPHTPGVVAIARVLSFTFVIGGLKATTQGLLQRGMAFRAIALTEIGSYVLGYAVIGVGMAAAGFGAWSLVLAALAQGLLAVVAFAVLCRNEIGIGFRRKSLRSLYSFGGRVSLIGFAEFIGGNLDTLWAGHNLGARATGFYTRATNLATVPLYYFSVSLSRVLLPAYSRIQAQRERLKATYLVTITVMGAIMMTVSWGVAGAAHEIVFVLLGARWAPSVPVLAILALAAPFSLLTHFGAIICEATATLNAKIAVTLARIVWLSVLLVALARFGVVGIATAFALSELITHLAYLLVMKRLLKFGMDDLQRAYLVGLLAGVVTGLALFGLHLALGALDWPPAVVLALQVALGSACLVITTTKARDGLVWREIRRRLVEAGYGGEDRGAAAWFIRRMDALTPRQSRILP
jgi:lipopolysaccharide exporter